MIPPCDLSFKERNAATQGGSGTVRELREQVESLSTALTHAGAQVRRLEAAATQQQLEVGAQWEVEREVEREVELSRSQVLVRPKIDRTTRDIGSRSLCCWRDLRDIRDMRGIRED